MVRYLIFFSYVGTKYKGVQWLPKYTGETIQGALEDGLRTLSPLFEPKTTTCSRTDKGVHAMENALHVDLQHRNLNETFQPYRITERLNFFLKKNCHDIVVNKTCLVSDDFSARGCARRRSYIYRLAILKPHLKEFSYKNDIYDEFLPISEKDRCYIVHGSLDVSKIQEALKLFIGTHDFSTFSKRLSVDGKDPVKTIFEFKFYPCTDQNFFTDPKYHNISLWEFYISGNSFLYHQVRKIVGTVIAVGYGFLSLNDVKHMLENPSPHLWVKSVLVPAWGLFLADIDYEYKKNS